MFQLVQSGTGTGANIWSRSSGYFMHYDGSYESMTSSFSYNQWFKVRIVQDFNATDFKYKYYINDALIWTSNNVNTTKNVEKVVYLNSNNGAGSVTVYYDDINVTYQ